MLSSSFVLYTVYLNLLLKYLLWMDMDEMDIKIALIYYDLAVGSASESEAESECLEWWYPRRSTTVRCDEMDLLLLHWSWSFSSNSISQSVLFLLNHSNLPNDCNLLFIVS